MTEGFLLDTNVVSALTNPRRNPTVKAWIDAQDRARLFISEATVGELHQGIAYLPPSGRRAEVEGWLQRMVLPMFHGRILPVDLRIWAVWGKLCGEGFRRGKPLPVIDALLVATAIEYNLTLATRDKGLHGLGAKLYSPWRS